MKNTEKVHVEIKAEKTECRRKQESVREQI
jgi:hypothetical protein